MVFSSLIFLYLFFPINILIYFLVKSTAHKNMVLLIFSLFFYAFGQPYFIVLLLLSSIVNYFLAVLIDKHRGTLKGRAAMYAAVAIDLSLLGFFKYCNFFIENLNFLFNTGIGLLEIGLPIGISFYTFKIISYIVDVYRGEVKAQDKFLKLLLYISIYHQIMSGPIIRYKDMEGALENRAVNSHDISYGIDRFVAGLCKKVLIANIAYETASVFLDGNLNELSVMGAWLGIIMYTLQIYFDFSGYSDMAIGLGKMMGFSYMENFNYPYIAKSVQDFWRRWHISLSLFFRDYVYIPLGGNRKHYIRNLFIVWLLTGFWHGASWNFIFWGLYYGIFLLIEKYFLSGILKKLPRFISHIYLLLVVNIGWVFFYFTDISKALQFIKILFGLNGNPIYNVNFEVELFNNLVFLIVAFLACTPVFKYAFEKAVDGLGENKAAGILHGLFNVFILAVCTAMLAGQTFTPFLYFKF